MCVFLAVVCHGLVLEPKVIRTHVHVHAYTHTHTHTHTQTHTHTHTPMTSHTLTTRICDSGSWTHKWSKISQMCPPHSLKYLNIWLSHVYEYATLVLEYMRNGISPACPHLTNERLQIRESSRFQHISEYEYLFCFLTVFFHIYEYVTQAREHMIYEYVTPLDSRT